jgi:hypothetical protein
MPWGLHYLQRVVAERDGIAIFQPSSHLCLTILDVDAEEVFGLLHQVFYEKSIFFAHLHLQTEFAEDVGIAEVVIQVSVSSYQVYGL